MPRLVWDGKTDALNFSEVSWTSWSKTDSLNQLLWGDNGSILQSLATDFKGKVDLIYLDPPFCSDANYHQKMDIEGEVHQQLAYSDNWTIDAYLQFIYERLLLLKSLLSPTGSIFLHCDSHQSHNIRAILDEVFGAEQFRNECIWHYTGGGRAKKYFSKKHDSIFWYSKTKTWTFNIDAVRVPYKETSGYAKGGIRGKSGKLYLPNPKGTPVDDTWDIPIINPMSSERNGYPTQKPMILLDRIIQGCSNPMDIVLDPFLGSGTTAESAIQNKRRFIGIDSNINSLQCTRKRLLDAGIVDFALRATQDIVMRKATVQLKAITADEWMISEYSVNEIQNPPLQYILEEGNDGTERINENRSLRLTELKAFTMVFIDGSQTQLQIPKKLSDTIVLNA